MRLIITIFLMAISQLLFAQQQYTTKSKKAIEYYEAATASMQEYHPENALVSINKAIDKDPLFCEAYVLRSYIYADQKQNQKAIDDIQKALSINPDFFIPVYLDLGGLYFIQQDFDAAEKYLNIFLAKYTKGDKLKFKAEKILASCTFAREAVKHPVPFNPVNAGPAINSKFNDFNPYVTIDEEVFVLTRSVWTDSVMLPTGHWKKNEQEDFYVSEKTGSGWSSAVNIGKPLSSPANEGALSMWPSANVMILTICPDEYGSYGEGRMGFGSCDLFFSKKTSGGKWSLPVNLGQQVNSGRFDSQPSVSPDGKDIYFASARAGSYGESDIYVVHFLGNAWSKPENLGPKINTYGFEDGVFIHPDNQTLYFASTGHPGMGGRDLYMCKRQPDGSWGDPVNLGYPINTSEDDRTLFIDAKGELAYFASNRSGGMGEMDIYYFKLPQSAKPIPVTYMKGIVYDEKTKKPLGGASFELIDLETNKQVVESFSDAKDGSFLVSLPVGKNYALNVSTEGGYLFFSENFELTDPKKGEDAFRKDVPMKKIGVNEKVVLKNIFFATDSYVLKPESKTELDKLVAFLNKNPTLKIEVGGHTDNQGSKAHNQTLSQNRANAVKEYLVKNGISADRLTSKGYADVMPIDSNDTEKGRANNRRTEFMVVQ
ncbi:MAG: OmpA family protein [Flavobacteriales bacterium]